ncbi:MAG: hypothetical protein JNG84_08090 [Archangium sp.]|nr:hypothetical protein [Archangium sp.]
MTAPISSETETEAVEAEGLPEVLREAARSAGDAVNDFAETTGVTPLVEEHPYGMVAAAVGIGYVLGGGLFSPTTARLVQTALKVAAIPAVQSQLLSVAEGLLEGLLTQGRRAGLDSDSE